MEEKQSGLKMSLERALDQTAALTGVSRATAQRILSKKAELPSSLIDQAPTVSKVTLDDFDQGVARRTIAGMYAQKDASNTGKYSCRIETKHWIHRQQRNSEEGTEKIKFSYP